MKVTLCGSTRFMSEFGHWNVKLSKAGHIVYSVATSTTGDFQPDPEEKVHLDLVHLRKILESDAILVLNKDGYIGESTKREIAWARLCDKMIYWLETEPIVKVAGSRKMTYLLGVDNLMDVWVG